MDVQSDSVGERRTDGMPPVDRAPMVRVVERGVTCPAIVLDVERFSLPNNYSFAHIAPPVAIATRTRSPDEAVERERNAVGAEKVSREGEAGENEPAAKCASFVDDIFLTTWPPWATGRNTHQRGKYAQSPLGDGRNGRHVTDGR